jgi:copper chaperone CopZ
VRSALESVEGVASVDVDFSKKTATVTCKDSSCDSGAMLAALEKAGYSAKVQPAAH